MSKRDQRELEKGLVEENHDGIDAFVKSKDGGSLGRDIEDRRVKEHRCPYYQNQDYFSYTFPQILMPVAPLWHYFGNWKQYE